MWPQPRLCRYGMCRTVKSYNLTPYNYSRKRWYRHVHKEPLPNDKEDVETTLNYLEACSNIFEKGHDRVTSLESGVLRNRLA